MPSCTDMTLEGLTGTVGSLAHVVLLSVSISIARISRERYSIQLV